MNGTSSSTRQFGGGGLARRLFALFLLASLLPLALSDWVSSASIAQIAQGLSLDSRAKTTRQTSRQVYDRLLAGRTLLSAMLALSDRSDARPAATDSPDFARVFSRTEGVAPDAGKGEALALGSETDLTRAWKQGRPLTARQRTPMTADSERPADAEIRVSVPAHGDPRVLIAMLRSGTAQRIAEFNPVYLWAPLADANSDSAWQVLDADGRVLTRRQGDDYAATGADLDGQAVETRSRLFLGSSFDAADWIFVQRSPRPLVLWQGERLLVWLALVALATMLLVALLARWQIRRTLVPLEQLKAGTLRVAAGDIHARVPVAGDDEIGALAGAFNEMAAHIEAQFDAMRGLAAIDRAILAGQSVDHLSGQLLVQLAALFPDADATVCWPEGPDVMTVVRLPRSQPSPDPRVVQICDITPDQMRCFAALFEDQRIGVSQDSVSTQGRHLTWLLARQPAAGGELVGLPIRRQDRTSALIVLVFDAGAPPNDELQPARELRDRLAVAFATRAREQELVYRAAHDSLTGLVNRYGLNAGLDELLAQGTAAGRVAVLAIDLDHFKDVNDRRGHETGDEVLRLAAARLEQAVTKGALVARPGGDEFVLVLNDVSETQAERVAAAVVTALDRPFVLRGAEYVLGASVGIAFGPDHGDTREQLLRAADVALYAAKEAGRGQFVHFTTDLDETVNDRLQLTSELRQAVRRSELVAYYQPRVGGLDGVVVSAEALVRWQHPERGLLPPGAFIELAETSGLIGDIGLWMLDAACAQIAAWHRQGMVIARVSVNVSPRQLVSGDLPAQVRDALTRHTLPAAALELEVTESLLVGDMSAACRQLDELRALGVSIALDDFGTGYSSMATLRQLPIDVMKIDRAFVKDIGAEESSVAVIRAIVALANAMDLQLVAEGVETQAQAALLESMHCDELQGYLYSPPVAAARFAELPGVRWSTSAITAS
ncbi:MAG: EAL domain-containing protein [Burkholderiales bacterium]